MVFELYTQGARRVIFLAREEAWHFGSSIIETEHLLLGILVENEAVATKIAGATASVSEFRKQVEAITAIGRPIRERPEIPLSADSKQILNFAVAEAEALGQKQVSLGHLLLGILRVETSTAAQILQSHGVTIQELRQNAMRDIRWADAPE